MSKPAANDDAAQSDSQLVADESDEHLMSRICEGDRQALGALFRRYARIVRGVAFKVLRDAAESDDMLQDIFVLIHKDCQNFDASKASARFWILQMTYRRAISRRRYLNSRHFYTYVDLEETAEWMPESAGHAERYQYSIEGAFGRSTAKRMFEALSKDQRETLRLHFFEGYTIDEIATKLGQSRGNIRHHCFRGLERLRKQLFATGSKCSDEK